MQALFTAAILTAVSALPASAFSLTPDQYLGNVRQYGNEPFLYISSGSQSRSIKSLNAFLGFRMPYGVSGSAAIFDLAPGRYQMTWRLQTNPDECSDELFLWNGKLSSLASSSEVYLPHEDGSNRITTDWQTTEFESFGRIILIALDGQRQYDTTLKLESINSLQSASVPEPTTIAGMAIAGFALLRRGRQS
jgi:hypothetical protein